MAHDQDPQPHLGNIKRMPSIFAAALAVMREKGRTYGESWKARGGRGAWYTLARPLDRLQRIVESDHGGDVFAAVAAAPEGGDGTALDAIRDLRNYLCLVEAEMVSRGVVRLPEQAPPPLETGDLVRALAVRFGAATVARWDVDLIHDDRLVLTMWHHVPEEVVQRATDLARHEGADEEEPHMGAGPIVNGKFTTLDMGHGADLWSEDLAALPWFLSTGEAGPRQDNNMQMLRRMFGPRILVASRPLRDGGHQVLVRMPD